MGLSPGEAQAGCEEDPARVPHQPGCGPCAVTGRSHFFPVEVALLPDPRAAAWSCPSGGRLLGQDPRPCPAPLPSALLQAVGGLHHGVAPLGRGQLPAEEGCGALRLHPLDLLTYQGKRNTLRAGFPRCDGPGPQWSQRLAPSRACSDGVPLVAATNCLSLSPARKLFEPRGQPPESEANPGLHVMSGQLCCPRGFCSNQFKNRPKK